MVDHNWGEMGVFYNPGKKLPKGIYILTFKEKDGPNDKASNVDRKGVFRLNLGISKTTNQAMQFAPAVPDQRTVDRGVMSKKRKSLLYI